MRSSKEWKLHRKEREAPNASKTGTEMFCNAPKSGIDPFNRSDYQITSLGKELIKYINVDFSE